VIPTGSRLIHTKKSELQ